MWAATAGYTRCAGDDQVMRYQLIDDILEQNNGDTMMKGDEPAGGSEARASARDGGVRPRAAEGGGDEPVGGCEARGSALDKADEGYMQRGGGSTARASAVEGDELAGDREARASVPDGGARARAAVGGVRAGST